MRVPTDLSSLVATLRPRLDGGLVATDFDGTLAPLTPDPEDSRPVPGTVEALTGLARRAQVAVITGRDAATVLRLGGLAAVPGIVVAGVYGVETWADGQLRSPDTPAAVERLRAELPPVVAGGDPAVWIEDKRLSLVVHARRAENPQAALARIEGGVRGLAQRLGFEVHPGADVLELRLPGFDKAGALRRLAEGRAAVLWAGDDLGDLPAFAEIARLRDQGVAAFGVGVRSSAAAREVAAAADMMVDSADDVVSLFEQLA